jgi:hypothetical protein
MSKTQYTVLVHKDGGDGGPDLWSVLGTADAASDKQAVAAVAKDKPGAYMAIPSRSWGKVYTLERQTVSKLTPVTSDAEQK